MFVYLTHICPKSFADGLLDNPLCLKKSAKLVLFSSRVLKPLLIFSIYTYQYIYMCMCVCISMRVDLFFSSVSIEKFTSNFLGYFRQFVSLVVSRRWLSCLLLLSMLLILFEKLGLSPCCLVCVLFYECPCEVAY